MLRNAKLTEHDLRDGLKLLILQDGRFWPASLHSTQLPDVYGLVMEKQRGNRPQIQPRDDILDQGVRFYFIFPQRSFNYDWSSFSKTVLAHCEKKCSSYREKLLKLEAAEGQKFANFLRSLEQFIQTVTEWW